MKHFGRQFEDFSQSKGLEKLQTVVERVAYGLEKEGVPVDEECRVRMGDFSSIYPPQEIERDKKIVAGYEREWYGAVSADETRERRMQNEGEQLEALKTIIFNKSLGRGFIAVRTCLYDDIENKVDNILIDKKTGNVVCAFDEVGETSGVRYEEKRKKIIERSEGGVTVKYGLKIDAAGKVMPAKVFGVPVFYLCLNRQILNRAIEALNPDTQSIPGLEKDLLRYFLESLLLQIEERVVRNAESRRKMDLFGEILKRELRLSTET